jgi:hypothetical protein
LIGIGGGIAGIALQMVCMREVTQNWSGVASGVFGTSGMFGGVLGPPILTSLADYRTHELGQVGRSGLIALNNGYHTGFLAGALLTCGAALLAAIAFRSAIRSTGKSHMAGLVAAGASGDGPRCRRLP